MGRMIRILTNVNQFISCLKIRHDIFFYLIIFTIITQFGCHKNLGFQGQKDKTKLTNNIKEQRVFNEINTLSIGEKCYQDLCYTNDNSLDFKYVINFAKQGNAESHQVFERDILGELQKVLNLNLQLQSFHKSSINRLKTNISNLKLNQIQTNFFVFVEFYVHHGSELKKNEANTQRVHKIKNLVDQTELFKNYTTNINKPERFYLELHKKDKLNDALNEEIKYITELNLKTKQDFKEILIESTDLFTELLLQKEKNNQLMKRAMKKSMTIHLFKEFVYNDFLKKTDFKYPDLKSTIQERVEKLAASKFDNQKSIDLKMNKCRATWNANYNLHPTDQQILNLKNKTQEVVQGMKSFLIAQYPELSEALANIQFQYPDNKEKIKLRWTTTIQKRIKQYEIYSKNYDLLSLENKFLFKLSNLSTLLNFDCETLFDIDPMDQFNTQEKLVTLSWVPAMYPQFAASLISHEVAHYIYDYVDNFHEEKICLAGKKDSEKYVEEDFSDVIASSYLLSLKNNQDSEYYACSLASLDEKQSLKNNDYFDNHSTNLFRALQHHIHQGRTIPDSCNDLIKEEQIKNVELSCTSNLLEGRY